MDPSGGGTDVVVNGSLKSYLSQCSETGPSPIERLGQAAGTCLDHTLLGRCLREEGRV